MKRETIYYDETSQEFKEYLVLAADIALGVMKHAIAVGREKDKDVTGHQEIGVINALSAMTKKVLCHTPHLREVDKRCGFLGGHDARMNELGKTIVTRYGGMVVRNEDEEAEARALVEEEFSSSQAQEVLKAMHGLLSEIAMQINGKGETKH